MGKIFQFVREDAANQFGRRVEIAVELHGTEQRLQGIRKYRLAPVPAGLSFTAAEDQVLADSQIGRDSSQRRIAHERCPQTAQVTLGRIGQGMEQGLGNHYVEYRVAEKLQAFVAAARRTPVRQRLPQQADVTETVIQGFA